MRPAPTRPPHIEPMPAALLADPLDYIFADHFRQRVLCKLLEILATAAPPDLDMAEDVYAFLRTDLPLHRDDEEEDFFPLLRKRCMPEDEIEDVLAVLTREHKKNQTQAGPVADGLKRLLESGKPASEIDDLSGAMSDFARDQKRHLMLENGVILPIARLRLSAADQKTLAERMAARRGLSVPPARCG